MNAEINSLGSNNNRSVSLDNEVPQNSRPPLLPVPVSNYINYLNQTSQHGTFVAVLVKFVEYIDFAVQRVFYAVKHLLFAQQTLSTYENLKNSQLNIYFDTFNKEDNGVLFTNAKWGVLNNDLNWSVSEFSQPCFFETIIAASNFDAIQDNSFIYLENALKKGNKHIIAIPLLINNELGAALHINFNKRLVSFVDSRGNVSYDRETEEWIDKRKEQAVDWLNRVEKDQKYHGNEEEYRKKSPLGRWLVYSPIDNTRESNIGLSSITQQTLYDSWSRVPRMIQLAYLVAKEGKDYPQIDEMSFAERERQTKARRKEMIATLNNTVGKV